MFFSFDYVIEEMVNVAAVQPWSASITPWLHAARLPFLNEQRHYLVLFSWWCESYLVIVPM